MTTLMNFCIFLFNIRRFLNVAKNGFVVYGNVLPLASLMPPLKLFCVTFDMPQLSPLASKLSWSNINLIASKSEVHLQNDARCCSTAQMFILHGINRLWRGNKNKPVSKTLHFFHSCNLHLILLIGKIKLLRISNNAHIKTNLLRVNHFGS